MFCRHCGEKIWLDNKKQGLNTAHYEQLLITVIQGHTFDVDSTVRPNANTSFVWKCHIIQKSGREL